MCCRLTFSTAKGTISHRTTAWTWPQLAKLYMFLTENVSEVFSLLLSLVVLSVRQVLRISNRVPSSLFAWSEVRCRIDNTHSRPIQHSAMGTFCHRAWVKGSGNCIEKGLLLVHLSIHNDVFFWTGIDPEGPRNPLSQSSGVTTYKKDSEKI